VLLIHRYLFKQLLAATAMAVGLLAFVLIVGNVLRQALDLLAAGRLDWTTFLYYLLILVPGVIPYALPLGLLTAILLVLGRFCAQHEYTAMRAAGLSLWTLVAPVLLLACLGTLLCLFINFQYAPASDTAVEATLANLARNNPVKLIQPGTFVHDFPGFVIYAGGRDGPNLRDFWVWVLDPQGRAVKFARGPRGHFDTDLANDTLTLTLDDAFAESRPADNPENFQDLAQPTLTSQTVSFVVPIGQLLHKADTYKKLSLMTLPELRDALATGFPTPHPTPQQQQRYRTSVQMQIQRHASGAFSTLALALLAIPLALKTGRSETFLNLGLALALALLYYLLWTLLGLLDHHPALHPELLLWLPNLLYETLALALLFKAAGR